MLLKILVGEKEMATHSSTLAWKIPWMEEPGRLQSVGSWRVGHNWATSLTFFYTGLKEAPWWHLVPPELIFLKPWAANCSAKQYVFLMKMFFLISYINETLYLLGNLPVFKIHVNCFMARDDSLCANSISKCLLTSIECFAKN